MTAKEYFRSVRKAERALWLIRQQQQHAFDMAVRLSGQSETHIRTPGARSMVENAAIRLADLDSSMQEEISQYMALVEQARQIIKEIPQERFREVLTLRYLCGHTWKTISDEMDYSGEKSVYKVHGWALQAAQKILSKVMPNDT